MVDLCLFKRSYLIHGLEIISNLVFQIPPNKEKEAARFAQLWNKIITSFREEDLINNRYYNLSEKLYGSYLYLEFFVTISNNSYQHSSKFMSISKIRRNFKKQRRLLSPELISIFYEPSFSFFCLSYALYFFLLFPCSFSFFSFFGLWDFPTLDGNKDA